MTADEIWEEVICDSVAEMNSFEGTDFTTAEEMAADFLPDLKEAVLESKKESRGPPAKNVEGKASIEPRKVRSQELETVENNRFERLRAYRDNLPSEWFAYTREYYYI